MNSRHYEIAWTGAGGLAFAWFWFMWFAHAGRVFNRSGEGMFLGAVVGGAAVLLLTFALFNLVHLIWTTNALGTVIGSVSRFIGKTFLVVWGIVMTAAVLYLIYPHLVALK